MISKRLFILFLFIALVGAPLKALAIGLSVDPRQFTPQQSQRLRWSFLRPPLRLQRSLR